MPHRRPVKSGSFGGPLEELVKHFPHEVAARQADQRKPGIDRRKLQEKIDVHALLFQMAWQLDRED